MLNDSIDLKEFLLTGVLGQLDTSLSVSDVMALIGKPNWVREEDINDTNRIVRFLYDNLEIVFLNDKIYLIDITYKYPSYGSGIPIELNETWYYWLKGMSYEKFKMYLKENKIEGRRVVFDYPNEGLSQLLEIQATGIQISFDEHGIIDHLVYTPTRPGRYKYEEL